MVTMVLGFSGATVPSAVVVHVSLRLRSINEERYLFRREREATTPDLRSSFSQHTRWYSRLHAYSPYAMDWYFRSIGSIR